MNGLHVIWPPSWTVALALTAVVLWGSVARHPRLGRLIVANLLMGVALIGVVGSWTTPPGSLGGRVAAETKPRPLVPIKFAPFMVGPKMVGRQSRHEPSRSHSRVESFAEAPPATAEPSLEPGPESQGFGSDPIPMALGTQSAPQFEPGRFSLGSNRAKAVERRRPGIDPAPDRDIDALTSLDPTEEQATPRFGASGDMVREAHEPQEDEMLNIFKLKSLGNMVTFVLVIDISNSMNKFNTIGFVKNEAIRFLASRPDGVQFEIIFFGEHDRCLGGSGVDPKLMEKTPENLSRIEPIIRNVVANHSDTRPQSALRKALSLGPREIVFLTDGVINSSDLDLDLIARENRSGTLINVIEFGPSPKLDPATPEVRERIAYQLSRQQSGHGNYDYYPVDATPR